MSFDNEDFAHRQSSINNFVSQIILKSNEMSMIEEVKENIEQNPDEEKEKNFEFCKKPHESEKEVKNENNDNSNLLKPQNNAKMYFNQESLDELFHLMSKNEEENMTRK